MKVDIGDRVELVFTTDEMTILKPGDQGTVYEIDGDLGDRVFWIEWANSEKLALLEEVDKFKVVKNSKKKKK